MNADNDNVEPITDLLPALGYPGQCIQRRLNNDSGAGANAGSRLDMTFVATDPLSELVWSPHKGLSLKCADCTLPVKRPSLLLGAGPSNMVLSPPHNFADWRTNILKPMDEGNMITSQEIFHVKGEIGETVSLARSPGSNAGIMSIGGSNHELDIGTSGNLEEMNTAVEASALDINEKEDLRGNKMKGICASIDMPRAAIPDTREDNYSNWPGICASIDMPRAAIPDTREDNYSNWPGLEHGRMAYSLSFRMDKPKPGKAQIEPMSGDFNKVISTDSTGRRGDSGSGNQAHETEVILASEVHPKEQCKIPYTQLQNLTSPVRRNEGFALVIKEKGKSIMKAPGSTSVPLEKLESTAENDLQALNCENDGAAVSKIMGPESAHEGKTRSWQDEDILPGDKNVPVKHSPTNSRIHQNWRKGKGKALSDGLFGERTSEEEDDSHESVESCNSAGLFSKGKKRWSFEQQLIIGSKRVKEQIEETPGSTSFIRKDSSFMNWISNMMKGYSKSDQDETTSLALTLAHPNSGHESHDRKVLTCNKNQDSGCRNMGFQTVFQSLYCPNTKIQETRRMNADYQNSNELELANKICDFSVTPIAYRRVNDNFCNQFLLSNEKRNRRTSGNGAGTSTQLKIPSSNNSASQGNWTNSMENNISCNLGSGKEKGKVSPSNSCLGKRKTSSAKNNDSEPPSEGKTTDNFGYRSDPLGSLWITRFSPKKSSHSILNLDPCTQSTVGAVECSAECKRLIPHSQNRVCCSKDQESFEAREYSAEDPLNVMGGELQNCAANTEASFRLKNFKGHNDQKIINKLNPTLPFQRFKSPEAMASIFARRLDAFKNIIPSTVIDNAAHTTTTCFFCGIRGHDLRDCPEIMETELEDLLRKLNSYNGAEQLHCLCIRCFQLNHWAVACPHVSSRRQHQLECGASMVNNCSSSKMQLNRRNQRNPKLLENKKSQSGVTGTHTACWGEIPRTDTNLKLNQKLSGMLSSDKMVSNSNPAKNNIALSFGDNESKENQIIPLRNFVHPPDVPKGIFDAVKRLRLSRTNILKWMNSHLSLSHLSGFFLRLRLGKWEEGLGGTGYYVACITGSQKEISPQSSKNPIYVNVGGIKFLVESQYVSNHDFLEDELMAWWCATLRCGGNIPSEDELTIKFEEKKKLGF